MEPHNANYRFNLGVVLERAGDMPSAAVAYRDTLTVSPQHAQAKAKLQAMGPQVHQYLASAPKLNVPPAMAPGQSESQSPDNSPPPMMTPPGGQAMGGAPIGGGGQMAPPAGAYQQGGPSMGMPAPGGPPGTVQCQHCFKYAKLGMVCEFCAQPLPPPGKPVALPQSAGGPMGGQMSPGSGSGVPMYHRSFSTPHRGGLILTLGILGFLICGICAIAAWVMGNKDLAEMDAGVMDDSGRGLTQAGRVIGIVSIVLNVLVIGLSVILPLILAGVKR
jgi:hypothetical protein